MLSEAFTGSLKEDFSIQKRKTSVPENGITPSNRVCTYVHVYIHTHGFLTLPSSGLYPTPHMPENGLQEASKVDLNLAVLAATHI